MCIDWFTTIPRLPHSVAVWCAILNVVLPGVGTMIAAVVDQPNFNKTQFWIGVFQLCTSFFLIGWAWSIWWGWLILQMGDLDYDKLPIVPSSKGSKNSEKNNNDEENQPEGENLA